MKLVLCFVLLYVINIFCYFHPKSRNSLYNAKFKANYTSPQEKDLEGSSWQMLPVAEDIDRGTYLYPAYVSNDNDVDLLLLPPAGLVSWIGNIRGASANYRPNEISLKAAAQFRVVEFDKDSKLEILELTSDRRRINLVKKMSGPYHELIWDSETIFNLDDTEITAMNDADIYIGSFLTADFDYDGRLDLLICINKESDKKSTLLRLLQTSKHKFSFQQIEFDNSGVHLLDISDFDNDSLIDILYLESSSIKILKNNNPLWISVPISPPGAKYYTKEMNYLGKSALDLDQEVRGMMRMYLIDYNGDGYLDIIVPDSKREEIGYYQNPGRAFWMEYDRMFLPKGAQYSSKNVTKGKEGKKYTNRQYDTSVSKWLYFTLIADLSPQNHKLNDFILVNINPIQLMNLIVIWDDSVVWYAPNKKSYQFYGYNPIELNLDTVENITSWDYLFDFDITKDGSIDFILFSEEHRSIYWAHKRNPFFGNGLGWSSNFWIFLMVFVYVLSLLLGFVHFYSYLKSHNKDQDMHSLRKHPASKKWDSGRLKTPERFKRGSPFSPAKRKNSV